jgi:hypothetical protein
MIILAGDGCHTDQRVVERTTHAQLLRDSCKLSIDGLASRRNAGSPARVMIRSRNITYFSQIFAIFEEKFTIFEWILQFLTRKFRLNFSSTVFARSPQCIVACINVWHRGKWVGILGPIHFWKLHESRIRGILINAIRRASGTLRTWNLITGQAEENRLQPVFVIAPFELVESWTFFLFVAPIVWTTRIVCICAASNSRAVVPIFRNFLRFLKKNLRFWSKFCDFRCDFDKNRALKTLAQNLKSGSENLKP